MCARVAAPPFRSFTLNDRFGMRKMIVVFLSIICFMPFKGQINHLYVLWKLCPNANWDLHALLNHPDITQDMREEILVLLRRTMWWEGMANLRYAT